MPKITALIHAHGQEDAAYLPDAIGSLKVCDEVLVINHGTDPEIDRIARVQGCKVRSGIPGVNAGAYLIDASYDWIFSLLPHEKLSETLRDSLAQWKETEHESGPFSVAIHEQSGAGGRQLSSEIRLVNRKQVNWTSELPPSTGNATRLRGDLLRFV